MPSATGSGFTNNTGAGGKQVVGEGYLLDVNVTPTTKAGDILAILPVAPQIWNRLNMGVAAAAYQRYLFQQFAMSVQSSAPSTATGSIAVAYISDPDATLPRTDSTALIAMLSTVKGYKVMPAFGNKTAWCNALLAKGKEQDYLFTDPSDTPGQERLSTQGKMVVICAANFNGFTGALTISLYAKWRINFRIPRVVANGTATDAFLPAGEYYVNASGQVLGPGGTALSASFQAALDSTVGVFYALAPNAPAAADVAGVANAYAYYSKTGPNLYLVNDAGSAAGQQGHIAGSAKNVFWPDTTFIGRSGFQSLRMVEANQVRCLRAQYGDAWKQVHTEIAHKLAAMRLAASEQQNGAGQAQSYDPEDDSGEAQARHA